MTKIALQFNQLLKYNTDKLFKYLNIFQTRENVFTGK